jgi:hypothetical protein
MNENDNEILIAGDKDKPPESLFSPLFGLVAGYLGFSQ